MPINISPPNLSALSNVARGGDLSSVGQIGLGAINQLRAIQQAQQQAALQKMALQDRAGLGLLANNRANRALDQQKYLTESAQDIQRQQLAQQAGQFQDTLGFKRDQLAQQGALGQAGLDLKAQQLAQEKELKQQQMGLAKLLDEKKESIAEKKGFASYAAYAMDQAKTPEEAQQIRMEILKEAKAKKYLDNNAIKALGSIPISQFKNQTKYMALQLDAVDQYKKMMDTQKKPAAGGTITLPDGTVIQSSPLTTGTTTTTQKDVAETIDMVDQLETITDKYADNYLTAAGKIKSGLGGWSSYLGLSSLPGAKGAEDFRAKAENFKTDVSRIFSQYLHKMTGSQFGMQEFERRKKEMINSDDDPVAFKAKAKSLMDYMKSSLKLKQKLLRNGIDVGTPEFEEKFASEFAPKSQRLSGKAKFVYDKMVADGVDPEQARKAVSGY